MNRKQPQWRNQAPGVKVLKLYGTALNRDWPRIVILELTAAKFQEFEQDSLAFDKKYTLFHPESPISWISTCAKPPQVKGVPPPRSSVSWTVVIVKGKLTKAACAAYPYES